MCFAILCNWLCYTAPLIFILKGYFPNHDTVDSINDLLDICLISIKYCVKSIQSVFANRPYYGNQPYKKGLARATIPTDAESFWEEVRHCNEDKASL